MLISKLATFQLSTWHSFKPDRLLFHKCIYFRNHFILYLWEDLVVIPARTGQIFQFSTEKLLKESPIVHYYKRSPMPPHNTSDYIGPVSCSDTFSLEYRCRKRLKQIHLELCQKFNGLNVSKWCNININMNFDFFKIISQICSVNNMTCVWFLK